MLCRWHALLVLVDIAKEVSGGASKVREKRVVASLSIYIGRVSGTASWIEFVYIYFSDLILKSNHNGRN